MGGSCSSNAGWRKSVCEVRGTVRIHMDKAGEVYRVGDDPVPLHSTYHLEIDRVYLSSPHIPADAVWKIDGTTVTSKVLEASEIGIGSHDLEYSSESTGETGRMMIKIVP